MFEYIVRDVIELLDDTDHFETDKESVGIVKSISFSSSKITAFDPEQRFKSIS